MPSGGTNRSRSFDFNVFASDLFNAITVRKTAEASIEEGSLGATVDLRTARPFDYKGFTLTASAQADYNDLNKKATPRGAFLISDIFADGKFGALFSVAYTKRKLLEEGPSTVRWAPGDEFRAGLPERCRRELPERCRQQQPVRRSRFESCTWRLRYRRMRRSTHASRGRTGIMTTSRGSASPHRCSGGPPTRP